MTLDKILKFDEKEYKCTSKSGCGAGEMYVFREIINGNGNEKLSDFCIIFQVYRNNGSIQVDCYNGNPEIKANFEEYLKQC
jgi:hypothetical protein